MKIVVNIKYRNYREQIEQLIVSGVPGKRIRVLRNELTKCRLAEMSVVVKRFAVPNWFQRIIYTLFRKSKAARSYGNALILRTMGIDTPEPIAYIEQYRFGLFHTGYYIARFSTNSTLSHITTLSDSQQSLVAVDLAEFTAKMHSFGVAFYDYNSQNILYKKCDDKYHFEIVDINRMDFRYKPLSIKDSIKTIYRLRMDFSSQFETTFLEHYAMLRGFNWQVFSGTVLLCQGLKK
ncbi:MAG: hypothetical protein IJW88_00270 [Alistipes sp.]|nr:hypothetical protein [Alistipes sp.]